MSPLLNLLITTERSRNRNTTSRTTSPLSNDVVTTTSQMISLLLTIYIPLLNDLTTTFLPLKRENKTQGVYIQAGRIPFS